MTYSDLIVLIPSHGLEDFPKDLKEKQAAGLLNAFAVVHHPSLIAAAETNPRWQRADDASEVRPDQLIILPTACDGLIPEGWIERSRREGSTVLTGLEDRQEMLDAALAPPQNRSAGGSGGAARAFQRLLDRLGGAAGATSSSEGTTICAASSQSP